MSQVQKASARSAPDSVTDHGLTIRLMEHLIIPTFVIDCNSNVIIWNKACERLTGISAAEVVNTKDHWRGFYPQRRSCLADLVAQGRYTEINQFFPNWDGVGLSDFGVSVETSCPMPKLGRTLQLAVDAGPIYDDSGTLIAVVETLRDITAQKEAQFSLESLAALDGLTNLANRRSFDLALANSVRRAARENSHLSVLMIDVDHFKAYNDSYGHQKGDDCLRAIALKLRGTLRGKSDIAARFGGEEFAIILPDIAPSTAENVAERLRRGVQQLNIPHLASSVTDCVTLSIGGACGRGTELDPHALVAAADDALYRSKHNGRNQSSFAEIGAPSYLF